MEDQLIKEDNNISFEIETKKNIATPNMVESWKKAHLKEGHSFSSTTTYYNYIKKFVDDGREITQKKVDDFREISSSGASAAALKSFFLYLVKHQKFPLEIRNIYFDKSKSTRKFPDSLEVLEVEGIINKIENLKDKYLTIFIATLGLRITEALRVRFEDINWITWLQDRTQQGSINLKNTKGGKFRTLPVPVQVMEMLYSDNVCSNKSSLGVPLGKLGSASTLIFDYGVEEYTNRKDYSNEQNLFGYYKFASDYYRRVLKRAAAQVTNKNIHPHSFRHFRAQLLLNKGLSLDSLQLFLGHADITSTSIYAKSSSEKLRRDLENLEKQNV